MTQAIERLYRLTVDASQANRQLEGINRNTSRIANGFGALQRVATAAFSAMGAIRGLTAIVTAGDKIELLGGSFEALLGSGERAADMVERVKRTVEETGTPLDDASTSFRRLTIGLNELGASNSQIEKVANTFIKLGRVSGTSMFDTNSALIQFSQGLASGVLQGDELRSIMERLPLITRLIADEYSRVNGGIEVSIGQIKKLGKAGQLSAELIANALLNASGDIDQKFSGLVFTLEQELNRLKSTATLLFAEFSEQSGIGDAVKGSVSLLNDALKDIKRNMGGFMDDMAHLVEVSVTAQAAIAAVALVLVRRLVPALYAAARAMFAFAVSNPLTAFLTLSATAILLFIKNWDKLKPFFLYEVPSWFESLLGSWNTLMAFMSTATQEMWFKIQNFFIAGLNAIAAQYNIFSASVNEFTKGKISFGSIDLIPLKIAGEFISDFTDKANKNFAESERLSREYIKALSEIGKESKKLEEDRDLLGGGAKSPFGDGAALKKINEGLTELREKVFATLDPLRELEKSMDDLHFLMSIGLLSEEQVSQYIDILDGTADAAEKAVEAVKKSREEWGTFAMSIKDAVDPMQEILRMFSKVDMAVEQGFIKPELAEEFKKTMIAVDGSIKTTSDKVVSMLQKIKDATDGFAREFTDTLVEGLKTGELAFKDFAVSILETMAKIVLNSVFEKFFALLVGSFGVSSGTSTGGGGFLRAGTSSPDHTVGVLQSPAYGRGQAASSSPVKVTVNNNSTAEVTTKSSTNSSGGIDLDILIEQKVAKAINGGALDKPMQSSYGLTRRAF